MSSTSAPRGGRIVVGIDGSAASLEALEWAAAQAELTGSTLDVVTTWDWPASLGWAIPVPDNFNPGEDAAQGLEATVATVRAEHPGLTLETRVVEGHPAPVLVEASRGADLLVVGSRGRGAFAGMLLGSVSEHCVSRAHCPVVVHRAAPQSVAAPAPRIVVGVDGSPAADRAVDWAVAEASRTGATLHLVSAWLYPMAYGYAFTETVPAVRDTAEAIVADAASRLRARAPGLTVTSEVIEQPPGPALVAAARDADLLVVGSRGIGGFEGLLLGSVSQYCSRHAACSVVVVR